MTSIRLTRLPFVALLAAAAVAMSTSACTGPAAGVGPGATSSPAETATSGADASDAGFAPSQWTTIGDLSSFEAAKVTDVISNGSGFVAVGSVSQNGATNGAIWTSADGLTWSSVSIDAALSSFMRVGHSAAGLVAMASRCRGTGECIGTIFWSSPDGTTWTQHDEDPCCWVLALATGAFGVVGVGTDWTNFQNNGETDVAVFGSQEGSSWTRPAADPSFKSASMGAVAPGGTGVVALGNGPASLEAWTSRDGKSWSSADSTHSLGTGEVRDMLSRSNGLVAVGRDASGAASWVSPDGATWSRTPDGTNNLQGALMERITATPTQIVAVGKDGSSSAGAIWTSADGLSWASIPSLPAGLIDLNAVAASGTTLVAFGTDAKGSLIVLRGQSS